MIGPFFRPEEEGTQLIAGLMKRGRDRDKLAYKAFLIGRQLGALERERALFYKEQADAAQQQMQLLLMMMNLQAQQNRPAPVLQGIVPGVGASPPGQVPAQPPMVGVPTGPAGALGGPVGGPVPNEVPGQLS